MNTIFKGQSVNYTIQGNGFPVVFLHGFNESSNIWDLIIPELSKHLQCICIDLPGFGKSSLPANLSISYMADAVYRVLDELKLVKPVILGHSMGGYVALELIHKHPDFLSGAGLIHSTTFADSEEKKVNRTKTIEFLEKNPLETFLKIFIQGLFAPFNLKHKNIEFVNELVFKTAKNSVIAATKAMMEREDRTDVLRTVGFPWLFIAGKHDQLIPIENMSLQCSYCSRAMFKILSDTGHLGMIEEPDNTAKIILGFVKWVQEINLRNQNETPIKV